MNEKLLLKKDEYNSVNENMRWFSNILWVQLTIYIAINAGLLNITFVTDPPLSGMIPFGLKICGAFFSIFFWILEDHAVQTWRYLSTRAMELEQELDFKQHMYRPQHKVRTNHLFSVFYSLLLAFWIFSLLYK